MKNFLNGLKNYFAEFGTSVVKGDIWTKLSLVIMGAGYFGRGQWVKGILMTLLEVLVIVFVKDFSLEYLSKFDTLGDVQREEVMDWTTLTKTVNDYDNSLLILLFSVVSILVIAAFVFVYIANMKSVYNLQVLKENGKHIPTFREDCKQLLNVR